MRTLKRYRFFLLAMVGLLALSLGACATSNPATSNPVGSEELERRIKVYESPT